MMNLFSGELSNGGLQTRAFHFRVPVSGEWEAIPAREGREFPVDLGL